MIAMTNVVFVTGNPEKASRLAQSLGLPVDHQSAALDEIQTINPAELVEYKVKQAYSQIRQPVLVEDVSFVYNALGDLPGPFVKFFVDSDDGATKMCRLLDGFENRRAEARCTFGYYDGEELRLFSGSLTGEVADQPRGDGGYGFDNIFIPDGFDGRTAAELDSLEYDRYYSTIKPFAEVREFLQKRHGVVA